MQQMPKIYPECSLLVDLSIEKSKIDIKPRKAIGSKLKKLFLSSSLKISPQNAVKIDSNPPIEAAIAKGRFWYPV